MTDVFEALRRGEAVRIINTGESSRSSWSNVAGHLVLAAETASADVLARWLPSVDGVPVFATVRDRLEQLRIVGAPCFDSEVGGIEPAAGPLPDAAPMVVRLSRAADYLSGAGPSEDPLRGLTVRCTDWGGVVNCPQIFEAAVDLIRLAGLAPVALIGRLRMDGGPAGDSRLPGRMLDWRTVSINRIVEYRRERMTSTLIRNEPSVRLPTRYGSFWLKGYEDPLTGQLHLALWTGKLSNPTLVRVHSECFTGDLLGSLRCDCGVQLDRALARLAQEGNGVLVYLRQEGRGIGLINKLRTYVIQDQGYDTVEANERIGFQADLRDYSLAAQILADLGVSAIRLLTNNPEKVRGLKKHGIRIVDRVPLVVESCSENAAYLDVKQTKMGHLLSR